MTACKSNLKNLGNALEMYSTDHRGFYPTALAQLTPRYLKTIPTCLAAASEPYSAGYVVSSSPAFTIVCTGMHHQMISTPNYPQYGSVTGLIERP